MASSWQMIRSSNKLKIELKIKLFFFSHALDRALALKFAGFGFNYIAICRDLETDVFGGGTRTYRESLMGFLTCLVKNGEIRPSHSYKTILEQREERDQLNSGKKKKKTTRDLF